MKNKKITLLAVLLLGALVTTTLLPAQNSREPYYEIASHLSVTEPVTYETLWQRPLQPSDQEILVPAAHVDSFDGLNIGFTIHNTAQESPEILESLKFTRFAFSVYHLREDGSKEPVVYDGGEPLVDIRVIDFGHNKGVSPYVAIIDDNINTGIYEETVNSGSICDSVQGVEGILVRDHSLPWDFCEDFTRPQVGEGYVVEWDIRFIPTASDGITYPEVNLRERSKHYADRLTFTYRVEDFEMPRITRLEIDGDDTFVEFKGKTIEHFVLERSRDLQNWEELPLGSPAIMDRGYIGANRFWWHLNNNGETQEFYRLCWKPEQQFWYYEEQTTQHRHADENIEWFVVSEETTSYTNEEGVVNLAVFEISVDITAIGDNDIYIPKDPDDGWGPISVLNYSQLVWDDPNLEATSVLTTTGRTAESGDFWVVKEGETIRFTLTLVVQSTEPNPGLHLVMPLVSFRYYLTGNPHPETLFERYGFQIGLLEE